MPLRSLLIATALILGLTLTGSADLPTVRLNNLFPPGGKQGESVEITLAGSDFEDVASLHFDHPGLSFEPVMQEKDGKQVPVANKFKITIAADTPLGMHDIRAVGRFGISNPRTFVVGEYPERVEKEPNNEPGQETAIDRPEGGAVTINGQINGGQDIDRFKFAGKKGERILVHCQAQQIDSKLNARMRMFDSSGKMLDSSDDYFDRDPFLDFTLPEDGEYTVWITDQVYDGSADYFYRLTVGTMPHIDYVLPPAGKPGTKQKFTLYGRNLHGAVPAEGVEIDGRQIDKLQVEIDIPTRDNCACASSRVDSRQSIVDGFPYRFQSPVGHSNSVFIGLTELPLIAAAEPNDKFEQAQQIPVPCEVYGQLQQRRDSDWFQFKTTANQVLLFEVLSQRMGYPVDGFLRLRRAKDGRDIGTADDNGYNPAGLRFDLRGDDPRYQSPALAEGDHQIALRDVYGDSKGGHRNVYRLRIGPPKPDYKLVVIHNGPMQANQSNPQSSLLIRQGGYQHLDLYVVRFDGFNDEVKVKVEGLPEGVKCPDIVVGVKRTYAPLVFSADEKAPIAEASFRVVGTAQIGDQQVSRQARPGSIVWAFNPQQQVPAQARVDRTMVLAVREGAPFAITAPESIQISRGVPLKLKFAVKRYGDFKGQLTGVTGHNLPPNVKNAAVNVPANKNEAELTLNFPSNVPVGTYTVALRSNTQVPYHKDPKGKKKNTPVTDTSNGIRLQVTEPVRLSGGEVSLKKGAKAELSVKVERLGQFAGDVTVSMVNLPKNVKCAAVKVPKDQTEAKLQIEATDKAAAATPGNVKIRAQVNASGTINLDFPLKLTISE